MSGRLWFRPNEQWELQASTGHLTEPEELEPGDVQRTTASAAWFKVDGEDFSAVTAGYGVNVAHETNRQSVFAEGTRRSGKNSIFGRAELVEVETAKLLEGDHHAAEESPAKSPVGAFTAGAVRDVLRWRGFEGGVGASVSFYAVPDVLKETHGRHPVSYQLFFRLRPPSGGMGRMWNMRMSRPMSSGPMQMQHD